MFSFSVQTTVYQNNQDLICLLSCRRMKVLTSHGPISCTTQSCICLCAHIRACTRQRGTFEKKTVRACLPCANIPGPDELLTFRAGLQTRARARVLALAQTFFKNRPSIIWIGGHIGGGDGGGGAATCASAAVAPLAFDCA